MAEQIEIDIVANDKTSSVLQGIFQGIGQSLANFALQIPGAIMNFGKDILDEANQAQLGLADLEATLKSTGGAAGMTEQALLSMAEGLSQTSRFSKDAVLAGENMLLTFTNIGKDVFPAATQALADIATKMKTDLPSAAIQLGKALNDPIAGISALTRIGVTFSDEQKNVIDALMKTGDVAGAQQVIIAELNKEFGGQAAASAGTFAGQMDILKHRFDEMKETIGTALIPILQELMDKVIMPLIPMVEAGALAFANWISTLSPFIERIANVAAVLGDTLMPIFQALSDWWSANGVSISFAAMEMFDNMWKGANDLGAGFMDFLQPILDAFGAWWATYGPAIVTAAQEVWDGIVTGIGKAVEVVGPFISDTLTKLGAWWTENSPMIVELIGQMAAGFQQNFPMIIENIMAFTPLLTGLIDLLLQFGALVLKILTGDFAGAWETAKQMVATAAKAIWDTIMNLSGRLAEMLGGSADGLKAWGGNWEQLTAIIGKSVGIAIGLIESLGEAIMNIASHPIEALSVVPAVLSGQRAKGGAVSAGGSYLVGEQGAEMFTPSTGGSISPNGAGGGNVTVNLNYSPSVSLGSRQEAENVLLPYILSGIRAAQANGYVPT